MKRNAVFLYAALAVILYSNSAFAAATEGCAEWLGSWTFSYGGSDNQTVYLNTVCDSALDCPVKSVITCYVTGIRASDSQPIMLATSNFDPGKWAYYHTYTPTNACEPYDRIAGFHPGAHYFDNVTAPTIGGPSCNPPPALGSGLTFGRRFSPDVPGTCKDWPGNWHFTYYNIATIDNTTDTKLDDVTITKVCDNDSSCTDTSLWECVANGKRSSDNMTITIGRPAGNSDYHYSEVDNETLISGGAYSLINDADFFSVRFTASQTTGFNYQIAPNHLISGNKFTTTTTSIPDVDTCDDWKGTWNLTYDSATDNLPDDKGNGRNGTYEVKICSIQKNITVDNIAFPCMAQGTRTEDGQTIFIARSQFATTKYRYYEIDQYTTALAVNGAIIPDENFTPSQFTASANTYGLVSGVKTSETCKPNCVLKIIPRKISKLMSFLDPISPFVIRADKDSGIAFSGRIAIDWGTEALNDIFKMRIGTRTIFGLLLKHPLKLESDNYTVVVTYGDNDTQQCGKIEVQ
jgi:hypothetical protein